MSHAHPTQSQILTENALRSLHAPAFLRALYQGPHRQPYRENLGPPLWQGALVRCRCFEEDKCLAPPFPRQWLAPDGDGWLALKAPHDKNPKAQRDFQDWMKNACHHPDMTEHSVSFEHISNAALSLFLPNLPHHRGLLQPNPTPVSVVSQAAERVAKCMQKKTLLPDELDSFANDVQVLLKASKEGMTTENPKGTLGILNEEAIAYFQVEPAVLLQSETHVLGLCELGVFVRERASSGGGAEKVVFLGPQLRLKARLVDENSSDIASSKTGFWQKHSSKHQAGFQLSFDSSFGLDATAVWQSPEGLRSLWLKTTREGAPVVLKRESRFVLEVARSTLLQYLELTAIARELGHPILGVS